jgi:hypothetical protein
MMVMEIENVRNMGGRILKHVIILIFEIKIIEM